MSSIPLQQLLGGVYADELPPIFHVAGTNGKGSTIAFLRAIAEAQGLRVHAFTKPHLFQLKERFTLASGPVDNDTLISTAERIAHIAPDLLSHLTQFDAQVATALTLFHETPADLVLLETGMGGLYDSTNVIDAPALSVITPIGFDHQDVLGATLEEIAAHKAGILRRDVPAIVARQAPEAMEIIEAHAARIGAPLFRAGVEWDAYASNGRLVVQTERRALDLPLPAMQGRHQIDNAGLACAAFLASTRFTIEDEAFARGIAAANWPGRLQPLTQGPLSAPIRAQGGEVWVDGGHNADAAAAIARALNDMKTRRGGETTLIVGLRARKDAAAFVDAIAPAAQRIVAVPLNADHIAPDHIASLAHARGVEANTAASLQEAMKNAAQFPAPRVIICGSFLLAAEALALESA